MNASTSTPAESAAPLDLLLVDAAPNLVRRFVPDISTAKWAFSLARKPNLTARRLGGLGTETVRILIGTSAVAPQRGDRRFVDVAWGQNPLLKRLVQLYLAGGHTLEQLVIDADLDPRDRKRVRFFLENLIQAAAPTNVPLVNPASAKEVIDTAGLSLLRGSSQLARDLASAPRIPEMVDGSGFVVGGNIAATPGGVVYRNEVLELIQYAPQTEEVYEVPALVVPPTINKFYAIDLAPERSLVEHGVRQGRQMFVISWRNPDSRHASWNLDTYVRGVLDALDAVKEITGSERTVLGGVCAGGILASIAAGYLAGIGRQDRLSALCLAVTVIDNDNAGTIAALADGRLAGRAKAKSARKGYLDGRALAEAFAWLRPGDLVWNYWVNNYLLGKRPPAFDILFWNSDTTRMSAALHADFVDLAMENSLTRPGALTVLGVPIDLAKITVDSYVVAGIADHITPWENCYLSAQLFGGTTRFVLSTSGHIAALVNPPGNPKASFHSNDDLTSGATVWLKDSDVHQGSWWTDLGLWLDERCGAHRPAPKALGSNRLSVLAEAPGTYVFDK
jgi:poly[(R)-3-hydroxyalkanoate] polymerase subunit PhaC